MIYRFASFEVDDSEFRLSQDGVPVVLEPKALRLLLFLVANPGRLIRKQELLDSVWFDAAVTENALARSVALIRKMLNDDSREPRFIETVPKVGYRFLAPVQVLDAGRAAGTPLEPASRAAFLTAPRAALFVACAALLIGTASWRLIAKSRHAGTIRSDGITGQVLPPALSIAILPIVNKADGPTSEARTDGFTEDLIRQVSEFPQLKVIARSSAFRYKGQTIEARAAGQMLHTQTVLTGELRRVGDQLVVDVELSDVQTDLILFNRQYFTDHSDLQPVQAEIVHDLAGVFHLDVPTMEHSSNTSSAEAYEAFLEGEGASRSGAPADLHEAILCFERAVRIDPKFSLAWGRLADANVLLGLYYERPSSHFPEARRDVEQALKLDPKHPSFHGTLGLIHLVYDWDYSAAAAELSSTDAEEDVFHVLSCSAHLMHVAGRSGHAEDLVRRMEANDPQSVQILSELGCIAYYRGDYKESASRYQEAMKIDSNSPLPYLGLGKSLTQMGKYHESVEEVQQFRARHDFEPPILTAERGFALAREGKVAEARQAIQSLQTSAHSGFVDPYLISLIYLGLHDSDATYKWLTEAADEKSPFLVSIITDPKWADSSADPRFVKISSRMNLPRN